MYELPSTGPSNAAGAIASTKLVGTIKQETDNVLIILASIDASGDTGSIDTAQSFHRENNIFDSKERKGWQQRAEN